MCADGERCCHRRFSYPSRPAVQVLKGFSLHIPRGSKVRRVYAIADVTTQAAHQMLLNVQSG